MPAFSLMRPLPSIQTFIKNIPPHYRIVLIYLVLGLCWIFFSDHLTESLLGNDKDTTAITLVQNAKGGLFIVATSLLLFILIRQTVVEKNRIHAHLIQSYDQTILGWVSVMDLRHQETKDHTARVTLMSVALAQHMGIQDPRTLKELERGAILHDIGKVGIPDKILLKPGPLSSTEMEQMRTHTQIAYGLLSQIDFLKPCSDIPYFHHEKWDGTGYPLGLKETEIPLVARIFAVVDVWDALIHPRVYKAAWPETQVLEYIQQEAGRHFDPAVVACFLSHYPEIKYKASACSIGHDE